MKVSILLCVLAFPAIAEDAPCTCPDMLDLASRNNQVNAAIHAYEQLSVAAEAKSPLKVSVTTVERADRAPSTLSVFSGEMPDIGNEIRVATLYCADLDSTAMLLIFPDEDPRTNAQELARSLACPKADTAEPEHPPIDVVFAPVCESGDLAACQRLIEYIQLGHANGSVMSLERARARACTLGDRDHCA